MSELTAMELNNVIVNLRDVVGGAVVRATRKLIAQMKRYEKARNQKKKKRILRYEAEMAAMKKLRKDDVTKFALLNVKSLTEFKFTNETPVEEVALYKVATESSLTAAVDEIRKTYPNWHQEIPFILQRLGQNSMERKSKKLEEDHNVKGEIADESVDLDESLIEGEEKPEMMKKSIEKSKAKVQKRAMKEKIHKEKKQKEKKQIFPPPPALKRTDVAPMEKIRRGEAVVKRINLGDSETLAKSSSEESDSEVEHAESKGAINGKRNRKGGFFLGRQAENSDESEEDDLESETVIEKPRREVRRPLHSNKPNFRNSHDAAKGKKTDKTRSNSFKRKQLEPETADDESTRDTKEVMNVHPSWLAKQMKLKQEAELMKAPPQNKRLKFED